MSPAKRLSRQRFRALCKRCRAWCAPSDVPWKPTLRRMSRWTILRQVNGEPWMRVAASVKAHARLAR